MDDDRQPPDAVDADGKPPHLDESVRRIRDAGRGTLDAAFGTGRAMRKLLVADIALSRSALGRAMAWTAVAIVFGASAWLLTAATMIAMLRNVLDWSWLASISLTALVSLALAALASWRASVFFDHTGLHATRRQLARMGIGDGGLEDEAPAHEGRMPPPANPATPPATRSGAAP